MDVSERTPRFWQKQLLHFMQKHVGKQGGGARLRQLSRSSMWRGGRASGITGLKLRVEQLRDTLEVLVSDCRRSSGL